MATKAEIAEQIKLLTGEWRDPDDYNKDEMEAMLAKAGATTDGLGSVEALAAPGGVTRRKVNRGSTRRINRALENMQAAIDAFVEEIDKQVYVTDEDGARIGSAPIVEEMRKLRHDVADEVAAFTAPPAA